MNVFSPVGLTAEHHTNYLDCGYEHLDDWLDKHAFADQELGKSRTHVWVDDGDIVVGYYTLLATTVRETYDKSLFRRLKPKSYQGNEVPGILIGKFALDQHYQGKGLGLDLLADAIVTAFEAVNLIGGVYLMVDPMDNQSRLREFYGKHGFETIAGTDRMFLNFVKFREGTPFA